MLKYGGIYFPLSDRSRLCRRQDLGEEIDSGVDGHYCQVLTADRGQGPRFMENVGGVGKICGEFGVWHALRVTLHSTSLAWWLDVLEPTTFLLPSFLAQVQFHQMGREVSAVPI